eukprot:975572-Pelagomonas_calceolata.AAC.1
MILPDCVHCNMDLLTTGVLLHAELYLRVVPMLSCTPQVSLGGAQGAAAAAAVVDGDGGSSGSQTRKRAGSAARATAKAAAAAAAAAAAPGQHGHVKLLSWQEGVGWQLERVLEAFA